jgi:hypothetical protein
VTTDPRPGTGPEHDGEFEHPRGTLAIVIVFGTLFALGFFVMYVVVFLGRGATH